MCWQVVAHLEPLQQRYKLIMEDEHYLDEVLAQGAGMLSRLPCTLWHVCLSCMVQATVLCNLLVFGASP